jgi:hypothetical protein
MSYTDRIKPTDKGITTYLDELRNMDFQIPTFQLEGGKCQKTMGQYL